MLLAYFTEQPMSAYPNHRAVEIAPDDHPARKSGDTIVLFSNKHFDRVEARRLYQERMIEYKLVEEVGFDAIMVNEHHGGPYCMNARCNVTSAALSAATERVTILQAGNPLPLWDNPVQLAEEIAMLDLMSGGRIIAGMIRGGGPEQIVNDCNPAYNRERFEEAHDLIIKAWTTPGPFRWDGEHYQVRVVNPWVLPLQQPHPRILVPGVSSPETIAFAAQRATPFLGLNTTLDLTKKMWSYYDEVAAEAGYESGPEHRGYLMRVHVAETHEQAMKNAEQFMWMLGEFTGIGRPHWVAPTGYSSFDSRMARLQEHQELRGLAPIADRRRNDHRGYPGDRDPQDPRVARGDAPREFWSSTATRAPSTTRTARPASGCSARKCSQPFARWRTNSSCTGPTRSTRRSVSLIAR